ncbi:hypothetical protein, partial [Staphylococcus hominis]|uniref:hypothetical protein n=1 Tax=Staphylococcus hominis TaxID=1290 RepID=UPI00287FC410
MSIEKYIECIKVLTLFCYINLDTYNKLQVLRKYKRNPNQTELIKIINYDPIKLPKLSISEETQLKHNNHNPKDIKYKNIENQFSNLLPNSVFFQYNIKFLKEKVVNLSSITNDELISMYIEHIIIRYIMNLLKLKFFDEILNIDDEFSFSNTNCSSFNSSLLVINID